MLVKRYRDERGPTDAGWLKSMHTFSFGHYQDPNHMGFGPLRVINEDRVVPGAGFGTHPHDNMEIISYVLKGGLAHKDSMGNGSTIKPGDIQIMSAGSGVTHSEYNASNDDEVHFLQIWIMPNVLNETPDYQQKSFDESETKNTFRVVISENGEQGSLKLRQDAKMYAGHFEEGAEFSFKADTKRKYWVQIVQGLAEVNGEKANAGDGFAIAEEDLIKINSTSESEILLFDLPV